MSITRTRVLLVIALALASCLGQSGPQSGRSAQAGGQSATAGAGGPNLGTSFDDRDLALVRGPHEVQGRFYRWVILRNANGDIDTYFERLEADGQGRVRMGLEPLSDPNGRSFHPTQEQVIMHEARQRYLVRYRDFQIRDLGLLRANYQIGEIVGPHTMAGRDVRQFRLTSKHGFGHVDLFVDRVENVSLGWTWHNAAGKVVAQLETASADFGADVGAVLWSSGLVPEQPYDSAQHDSRLGVRPLRLGFAPAGFALQDEVFFDAAAAGLAMPPLHLVVLSDGLQVLLVAQQEGVREPGTPPAVSRMGYSMFHSMLGGVRVLEAQPYGQRAHVVGGLSEDDMVAVLTALRR